MLHPHLVRAGPARAETAVAEPAATPAPAPGVSAVSEYERMTQTGSSEVEAKATDYGELASAFLGPVVLGVGGVVAFGALVSGRGCGLHTWGVWLPSRGQTPRHTTTPG